MQSDSGTVVNGFKTKSNDTKLETTSATSMTTFGQDLDEHLLIMGTTVPTIVTKCIEAIEEYGILMKVGHFVSLKLIDNFYHINSLLNRVWHVLSIFPCYVEEN